MDNGWWNDPDLVFTLLDIADGFGSESNFITENDRHTGSETPKNRRKIAWKAFSVLCLKFFGTRTQQNEESEWWWMLEHDVLFQKVLWFLRMDEDRRWEHMHNGVREGQGETESLYFRKYKTFIFELAKLGWTHRLSHEFAGHCNSVTLEAMRRRLTAAKPQFITLLRMIRQLHWLQSRDMHDHVIEMDQVTIQLLTNEALTGYLYLPKENSPYDDKDYRQAKSLEEALYGGSVAAQIVLLHEIERKEKKRFEGLRKDAAERRREQERVRQQQELAREQAKLNRRKQALEK